MTGARTFEHTADVGLEAWGPSREAVLEAAAGALCAEMYGVDGVEEREAVELEARGADDVERAVHFLQEVLASWHVDRRVLRRFEVEPIGAASVVRARAWGERFDRARHEVFGEVKAVTYHRARFEADASGTWRLVVVLDI